MKIHPKHPKSPFHLLSSIWDNTYPGSKGNTPDLSYLEKSAMTLFVVVRFFSISQLKWFLGPKVKRTHFVEFYVLVRFIVLIFLALHPSTSWVYVAVVTYFLVEGFNYRLCVIFVDSYHEEWSLRSRNRSLLLLIINYFEMVIGFAALYLSTGSVVSISGQPLTGLLDALYFSLVTISTLGFGDFIPHLAIGKKLVIIETLLGFIFVVLVVATFVNWRRK